MKIYMECTNALVTCLMLYDLTASCSVFLTSLCLSFLIWSRVSFHCEAALSRQKDSLWSLKRLFLLDPFSVKVWEVIRIYDGSCVTVSQSGGG